MSARAVAAAGGPGRKRRDPQDRRGRSRRGLDRAVLLGLATAGRLRLHRTRSRDLIEPIPLVVPGLTAVPWAAGAIDARLDSSLETPPDETVDFDQISAPGPCSCRRAGDRFEPLGWVARACRWPISSAAGISIARIEARVPLVCDQNGIIWVVGHRIADRVKVSEKTRRRLGLRWSVVTSMEHVCQREAKPSDVSLATDSR